MGLHPFVVFDCVATEASNSGSEFVDVLLGDAFPLNSCSFKWQWRNWDRGPLEFLVYPLSVILQSTPITSVTASVSHQLCGSNLLVSHALNTPSAFSMKHSALLFRIPIQIPNLYLGFLMFVKSVEIALPTLSHQVGQILVLASCHAVSRMASSRHDPFDIWTGCILHVPPTTAE